MYKLFRLILFSGCFEPSASQGQRRAPQMELPEELNFPTRTVNVAERLARSHGIEVTSLLLLNLGSILTQGSFKADANLLSLRPWKTVRPWLLKDRENLNLLTNLWQALAAPLKIIIVVSQDKTLEYKDYFNTDFNHHLRHKFICVLLTRTAAQDRALGYRSLIFQLPTVALIGTSRQRSWCFENRDNLFWQYIPRSIDTCDLTASTCTLHKFREILRYEFDLLGISYGLDVRCNRTELWNIYVSEPKTKLHMKFHSWSRWNVRDEGLTGCFSYIPFSPVDVSAFAKPFSPGSWCLILTTVLVLATAWLLIVRRSPLTFSVQIILGIVSCGDVNVEARSFSSTMIGCVALAFAFLIGQVYSNSVMSCFLDPTYEVPSTLITLECTTTQYCNRGRSLDIVLRNMAACSIPRHTLNGLERPLRAFRPPSRRRSLTFALLGIYRTRFDGRSQPLPLVPTQSIKIWDQILQHGIVSPRRMSSSGDVRISSSELLRKAKSDQDFGLKEAHRSMSDYRKIDESRLIPTDLEFVSFNTTREWFETTSFVKLLPLFASCFSVIVGAISLELGYANQKFPVLICKRFMFLVYRKSFIIRAALLFPQPSHFPTLRRLLFDLRERLRKRRSLHRGTVELQRER